MKTKKENRGGYRPNAGRKPKTDKKKQVAIGILESDITKLNGIIPCQNIMKDAIETSLKERGVK